MDRRSFLPPLWMWGMLLLWAGSVQAQSQPLSLQEGIRAQGRGEYEMAKKAYEHLMLGAQADEARLHMAELLLETGRYEEAIKSATVSAKGALLGRAQTVQGEAHEARGRYDEAETAYRRALEQPDSLRARVRLGLLLHKRGRLEQARPLLMAVIGAYNDDSLGKSKAAGIAYTAMAARALRSHHDANDAFRESAERDRSRVETHLQWAALFLEKYDRGHAAESVKEALQYNPHRAESLTLQARLQLARSYDFGAVSKLLDKALAANPNLAAAHVTRAKMALREMEITEAQAHLKTALAVNPRDLETLSVVAATHFLADDAPAFEAAKQAVLAENPRFSRMYSIIAEYAEWEHRYPELVAMAQAAIKLDADDALAHATLGFNLLRTGKEKKGLKALNQAWSMDKFNVHVFNTLNLYDDVIQKDYVDFSDKPFVFRTHKDERKVLEPYLGPTLKRAHADMVRRYGFTPAGPLRVEMYANPQHFSVRTTGLPNVGVQGVCFGKVITAVSPAVGPFNWGQITWHELSHVFHLQLSKNRVPRWFTEGLAEYETIIARHEWKREEDHELFKAMRQGGVPPLSKLNRAFTQARSPDALMTAYYVASKAVSYLVGRFGFGTMPQMLQAWAEGKRTPQVFEDVLGVPLAQLDKDFEAHLQKQLQAHDSHFRIDFSRYLDLDALKKQTQLKSRDSEAWAALSLGYLNVNDFKGADDAGRKALRLDKRNVRAHFALTRVALQDGNVERAEKCLRAILAEGHDGYILRLLLAQAALAGKRLDVAVIEVEAAARLEPSRLEAWKLMIDLAEKRGDNRMARRALHRITMLDQHDRLSHLALMAVLHKEKEFADLARVGESALFIDPANPLVHQLLALARLELGDFEQALAELDQALVLGHPQPGRIHLGRARALRSLKRLKKANDARLEALVADPSLKPALDRIFQRR